MSRRALRSTALSAVSCLAAAAAGGFVDVEIPVLEYEPFRTDGAKQTLEFRFQFGAGFDKPVQAKVISPVGIAAPSLNTRYFGYVRMVFEGRRYL